METLKRGYSFFGVTEEILFLARRNARGRLWLLGGGVYRPLIEEKYGNRRASADFDFIGERCAAAPYAPDGWEVSVNTMGGFKFKKGDAIIDFWSFENHAGPKPDEGPWNLNSVLRAVPLNIQSIAYDLERREVVGRAGLAAIDSKVLRVNYFPALSNYCSRKGISGKHYMETKAKSLGFSYELEPAS